MLLFDSPRNPGPNLGTGSKSTLGRLCFICPFHLLTQHCCFHKRLLFTHPALFPNASPADRPRASRLADDIVGSEPGQIQHRLHVLSALQAHDYELRVEGLPCRGLALRKLKCSVGHRQDPGRPLGGLRGGLQIHLLDSERWLDDLGGRSNKHAVARNESNEVYANVLTPGSPPRSCEELSAGVVQTSGEYPREGFHRSICFNRRVSFAEYRPV